MGKPTGFMEIPRVTPKRRPVAVRIQDWREIYLEFPESALRDQAARCMDCGIPFCHHGCPLGNLVPDWNDLVYRGRWAEALERLHATNNFPEFTGRVCPAPCEGSCVLGINADPVTIKQVEVTIVETGFERGLARARPPAVRTGKRVAVIGSGPAGLAAADHLNRAGHWVTVFERADRVGGLLRYGIPEFKLEKWVVDRRLRLMQDEGVRFVTNAHVGVNVQIEKRTTDDGRWTTAGYPRSECDGQQITMVPSDGVYSASSSQPGFVIRRQEPASAPRSGRPSSVPRSGPLSSEEEFDAIVIAIGATKPRDLPVPGRELDGIHFAMEYLPLQNKRCEGDVIPEYRFITAKDKHVIIIGGGDTGADCLGTAHRQGAKSVTQLELLPPPPLTRAPDNPWPLWPVILRTSSAHEEGGVRDYSVQTKRFSGENGKVKALHGVRVEMKKDPSGRLSFEEIPGTEFELPAELVLLAMGFLGPETSTFVEQLGLKLDPRGNVAADDRKMTSEPGIFVAGDATRGQSLVVWAITEGRRAARGVDEYLMGVSDLACV